MHATIRRYDGVDQNRTAELTSKVNETLVPKLEELPGARLGRRPESTTSLGAYSPIHSPIAPDEIDRKARNGSVERWS